MDAELGSFRDKVIMGFGEYPDVGTVHGHYPPQNV